MHKNITPAVHTRIITWLLENPGRPLTTCARDLDIPATTLYRITATDAFRDQLARESQDLINHLKSTLHTRLEEIAQLALDRLTELLETTNDPRVILDAMKTLFLSLGYAPKQGKPPQATPPANHLHLHVPASTISEARKLLGKKP